IPTSSHLQTTTTCSASVLTCKTIDNKIKKNILHSWRGILKACKEKDVGKLGEIPVSDFLDIAEKFNLDLNEGEINHKTTKYDFKKNGRFAYYDFLQSSILLLKPQESSLLPRVIIQKPQKPVLREYSITLTEEELLNVLEYYDRTLSSKISYNDFLRAFVQ
uniref:EF-hand calcium-binding domain-containing protein 6 n=1 Tax=Accipiter nisus TaxID=211598 RepID=A0A8B9M6A9_9AVES